MMVPYAGKDPLDDRRRVGRPERALFMFRNGKDTAFIAGHFGVKEWTVLRWITVERSLDIGEPNPYGGA